MVRDDNHPLIFSRLRCHGSCILDERSEVSLDWPAASSQEGHFIRVERKVRYEVREGRELEVGSAPAPAVILAHALLLTEVNLSLYPFHIRQA